jgi:uncharacterized membrane protein
VILGYVTAWIGRVADRKRCPAIWILLGPLLALWIVFLPNSCYLFTESRHLLQAVEHEALWTRARHEPSIAIRLALGGAVSLLYCSAGAMTFALSIRPVNTWLSRIGVQTGLWAPPFFLLVSLGVYLGLVVRFNSWDLLTRPDVVLETVAGIADRPLLLTTLMLFAFFLWAIYVLNDIWIDGFQMRWRRWTRGHRDNRGDQ